MSLRGNILLAVALWALCGPSLVLAAQSRSSAQDVNYVDLAALLARDGNYDRASATLQQVDTKAKDFDRQKFHLVRGIVRLNQQLFGQAAEDFQVSIDEALRRQEAAKEDEPEASGPDLLLYVYLGQSHFYAEDYEPALLAMQMAGPKADEIRSTFALRSEALYKLERPEEGWAMLTRGYALYPDYHELLRRKVFIAIRQKLFGFAARLGTAYLERAEAGYEDYIAIGTALLNSGSPEKALAFIELARLRNPEEAKVTVQLAQVYRRLDRNQTAADLLERLAYQNHPEVFGDAAELYRAAGDPFRALSLNRFIVDSKDRLRQRLAILIDQRNYAAVAAMQRDLARVRLMDDESIRYAVAYSRFQMGDFEEAEDLLSGLRDPSLFRKATELRQTMQNCRHERWKC
ncbi:MAG: hypothetical protein AAF851_13045 [Myxococcota bacterium]